MGDLSLESLWQYRGLGIEWYYAIFYYIVTVPLTFMFSSVLTEVLMRSISNVVCRMEHRHFWWVFTCHAMYSMLVFINKWMWPAVIIYVHYGNTVVDYVSVTGTITIALYALWAKLQQDVSDVYKAAEKKYNLR